MKKRVRLKESRTAAATAFGADGKLFSPTGKRIESSG